MLVPRSELSYDFKGAAFELTRESDRKLLAWIFNQFLYGEVTGIQCGHWLYRAPHLNAAAFLAKQAGEELAHVRKILRILSLLGEPPAAAHPAVRFLSTGMMGGTWGEHVAIEMALGEGLVLGVFYALIDTIRDPEIHRILEQAALEEERHCEFGERETLDWLERFPSARELLLGLALVQVLALRKLKGFVSRRLRKGENAAHPVLAQFDALYDHSLRCMEARIDRLGLSRVPLAELGAIRKAWLLATIPPRKLWSRVAFRRRLLTATYLEDPVLRSEAVARSARPAEHPRS